MALIIKGAAETDDTSCKLFMAVRVIERVILGSLIVRDVKGVLVKPGLKQLTRYCHMLIQLKNACKKTQMPL